MLTEVCALFSPSVITHHQTCSILFNLNMGVGQSVISAPNGSLRIQTFYMSQSTNPCPDLDLGNQFAAALCGAGPAVMKCQQNTAVALRPDAVSTFLADMNSHGLLNEVVSRVIVPNCSNVWTTRPVTLIMSTPGTRYFPVRIGQLKAPVNFPCTYRLPEVYS